MADFSSLKQTIQTYIKQNGNEEITGNILQDVLLAMVSTMGDSAINSLASALQDEIAARQNQDGILQGNITAENTARQQADTTLGGRIDGLQTAINGINTKLAEGYIYAGIVTPSTNPGTPSGKVFYIAVSSGTYTNFSNLTVAQGINILKYNGSVWSKDVVYAIDARPKKNSQNPVTSGGVFDNMGALDVSELNATENPHTPAIYADLSAALATIQTDYQKGGMSIKFIQGTVQSSDNTYVQYRLMNQNWSTIITDWQGVKDKPTTGSQDLITSGGVFDALHNDVIAGSLQYEQTSWSSGYKSLALVSGKTYKITIQLKDVGNANIDLLSGIVLSSRASGTAQTDNLLPLFGGVNAFKDNAIASIYYTPAADSSYISFLFVSSYSPASGNEVNVVAKELTEKYLTHEEADNCYIKVNGEQSLSDAQKKQARKNMGLGNGDIDSVVKDSANLVNNSAIYNELYEKSVAESVQYEQTATNPNYTAFHMDAGKTYKIGLKFTGLAATSIDAFRGLTLFSTNSAGGAIIDITQQMFTGGSLRDGEEAFYEYTPQVDVSYIKTFFTTGTTLASGNQVDVKAYKTESKYVSRDELVKYVKNGLQGKKVLMLGDSITQLPFTGGQTGMGIVEYFAQMTGATTIRGAFGGSHIRARRVLNSTSDITDLSTALAAFDLVYIVRGLCTGDWTLQDYAWQFNLDNDLGFDISMLYILTTLKALDMTTVSYVTIFSGTNDYNNNVPLGDDDKTNIRYEYGAWDDILENLSDTYQKLNVFVFSPIVKMIPDGNNWIWCEDTQNMANLKLHDYVQSNKDAAKRFMFPFCDLFYEMGWNQFNFWEYFNSNDGTHPRKGYAQIARKMASFVTAHLNRY